MSFHSNINFFIKLVTVLEIRLGGVTYITRPDFTGKKNIRTEVTENGQK